MRLASTWNHLNGHQFGFFLVSPVEWSLLSAFDDQWVTLFAFLRKKKSGLGVVDDHVSGVHCCDLCVERLILGAAINVCVVAEFEKFITLREAEFASTSMSERNDWNGDVLRLINLSKHFSRLRQHVYDTLNLLFFSTCSHI